MIFVKLDTRALTNGKFLAAGPLAFALYVKGLLYAKDHMTDGVVPDSALPLLCLGIPDPFAVVAALVDAGLWEAIEGGYTVGADRWAEFQQTKAQVQQSRDEAAERKRRSRERHKDGHADVTRDTTSAALNVTLPESESESEPESDAESESITVTNVTAQKSDLIGLDDAAKAAEPFRSVALVMLEVTGGEPILRHKIAKYLPENSAVRTMLAQHGLDATRRLVRWVTEHKPKALKTIADNSETFMAEAKAANWGPPGKRLQSYQQERQTQGYSLPKFRPGGSS